MWTMHPNKQDIVQSKMQGFSLVSAIFILVILSLVGTYIVSISALSRTSGNLVNQGVKAYYAASSGLEWAIYKVAPSGGSPPYNCPASPSTFNVSIGGFAAYTVTVTCSSASFTENQVTYKVFQLTSTGQYGTVGSADYASRVLYTTVVQPGV